MQRQLVAIGPYSAANPSLSIVNVNNQSYPGQLVVPGEAGANSFRITPYLRLNAAKGQDVTSGYKWSWPPCPQVPGLMSLIAQVVLQGGEPVIEEITDGRWFVYNKPIKEITLAIQLPCLIANIFSPPDYLSEAFANSVYSALAGWNPIQFQYQVRWASPGEVSTTPFDSYPYAIPLWQANQEGQPAYGAVYADVALTETAPPIFKNPVNLFGNTDNAPSGDGYNVAGPIYVLPEYQRLRIRFDASIAGAAEHIQVWSCPGYANQSVAQDAEWALLEDIPAANWKDTVNHTYVLEIDPQDYFNEWLYFICPGASAEQVTIAGQAIARLY